MEFRLLGPLEAHDAGRGVPLGPLKQRILLALLLLDAGRVVPADRLIEALWGEEPPASARGGLQAYVSKLRKALGDGVEIVSRAPGYLVELEPGQLDLDLFEQLVEQGRGDLRAGSAAAAESAFADALDMWRGPALADLAAEGFASADASRLNEARLTATEDLIEARIALGRHPGLVGELEALVAENPLRERLRGQLMLVLYASGRQAEALTAYREARRVLVDELGIEPSPALQELHARILRQDPSLVAKASGAEPQSPGEPAPARAREERKLVTVVFADLIAAVADHRRHDPERLRAALAPHEARIEAELERYGATVDRAPAGATVAVFGAPLAHEDDTERAVHAALRVVELAHQIGRDAPELELAARVGVATGEAIVEVTGHTAGAAMGDVMASAMRLQQAAAPGAVLVDEPTAFATRRAVEWDEAEPVSQDGERAPLQARRARARLPAPRPRTVLAPFVGRRHELALLEQLHQTVVDERRPRLVTIVGDAGVGKTRLVDEFVRRVKGGASVHRGRCLPYGEGITYWALREILWDAAQIRLDDPAETVTRKLHTLVARVPERVDPVEANRLACALGISAGMALPGNPLEGLAPESVAEEVGLAWPTLLSALAAAEPAVVVVEDLHWAEPPLLDMLELILTRAQGPLLVVATARPELAESRPGWGSRPVMSQIGLEPLTEYQARELVGYLLPGAGRRIHDSVLAPAEGNPFFTEEIVRHLTDAGPQAGTAVPDTIRALLAARIDALPDTEKCVLQDAAVVGRTFWVTTLEWTCESEPVRECLRSLEDRGLVVARPGTALAGQMELSFSHALTREVAYRSIPRGRRARTHARVGRWLEELAGERRAEFVDLLAHHFEAAAHPEDVELAWPPGAAEREEVRSKAVQFLLAAGHASHRRLSAEQALRFADRAMALAATDRERMEVFELKGLTYHAMIRGDEGLPAYLSALELARSLGDGEAVSRIRASAVLLCTRYMGSFTHHDWREQAVALLEQGLDETGDEATFERGALLVGKSFGMARWRGEPVYDHAEARRDAGRAIEIAEAIESPTLLANAVEGLTWLVFEKGWGEAAEMGERLTISADRITADRVEAYESLSTAAICFARAGMFDRAREVAALTTRLSVGMSPHRTLHAGASETWALMLAGRIDELLAATIMVEEQARAEGERICTTGMVGLAGRVAALFESGQTAAAERGLDLIDSINPGFDAPTQRSAFRYFVAELVRPAAGLERTRRTFDSIPPRPHDVGMNIHRLRLELPLRALSREWDRLGEIVDEAREVARVGCAPPVDHIADWALAAWRAQTDGAEALERARDAAAALEDFGERYTAARLMADLVACLPADLRAEAAEDALARLTSLGASGSAAQLSLSLPARSGR